MLPYRDDEVVINITVNLIFLDILHWIVIL